MKKIMCRKRMTIVAVCCFCILLGGMKNHSPIYLMAQGNSVQYEYDSLGRVNRAIYPDNTYIEYCYDKNGNITDVKKGVLETGTTESTTEEDGDNGTTEQITTEGTDKGTIQKPEIEDSDASMQQPDSDTTELPDSQQSDAEQQTNPAIIHDTAKDIKQYNKFKKRKVVIKSLKLSKKKSKRYLTIQIKQVKKWGMYGEIGYQVKYATNRKMKKAKTINVTRKKRKSVTRKQWKVKKNKTYYVKARAYLKTKAGKRIYTKYSKVRSIKVK